ncbi:MAG: bifunctional diaminohydroxyphosphoribosylaminopyrimidine deaminase/5-amino-6-(5-phosphoribosylamino)uracil reductase RibD, partial [Nocardioidaceae bacterium]
MASQAEIAAMREALDAARGHRPRTLPNPRVGCVLIGADGGRIAAGTHRGAGTPHAEIEALARAGRDARGATAVVTLEPCNHTGRTGPCAHALAVAGVVRVVFAQPDPHPPAAGGADTLRAAGVEIESGVLEQEARELNEPWTTAVSRGYPFVTWKLATTLDGRSAAADGTSHWITGEAARADVQRLRAQADAIVVGTGTALADDPRLTLRDADGAPRPYAEQPLRVVVGQRPVPADARVRDDSAPSVLITGRDVGAALAELAAREIRHVWLEGGP